ncbi:arfaptin-1-like [Diretmus argenteus]
MEEEQRGGTTEPRVASQVGEEEEQRGGATEPSVASRVGEEEEQRGDATEPSVASRVGEEEEQRGGAAEPSVASRVGEEEEQRGGAAEPSVASRVGEEEEQRGGAAEPRVASRVEEEEEEQRGGATEASVVSRVREEEEQRGGTAEPSVASRVREEEQKEVGSEVTPPGEVNHTDQDVTSCQTEPSPEVTMETEQNKDPALTLQKTGSIPVVVPGNNRIPASQKLERVRKWSISAFKFTRQVLSERLGRGSRTVDLDLGLRLDLLREDRRRYDHVTKLAQTLANQLAQITLTQKTLGDAFAELSIRTSPLHVEFGLNAEGQRFFSKSGETLAAAINSFTTDMNTLVNKTMEDTLINARTYEAIRIEYDAYRCDLEDLNLGPRDAATQSKLDLAQRNFQVQRDKFQKTRDDLSIKLKLLEENKVKVLHNQLLLLHGAMASYSSSCHHFLDESMHQVGDRRPPGMVIPSWLEDS